MSDLGCDFFVAGCHKWLFGPRGTGIAWGKMAAWAGTRPVIPPFYGAWVRPREKRRRRTDAGRRRDDSWRLPFLRTSIGRSMPSSTFTSRLANARWPKERIHEVESPLQGEGLAGMGHVTLHTPMGDDVSARDHLLRGKGSHGRGGRRTTRQEADRGQLHAVCAELRAPCAGACSTPTRTSTSRSPRCGLLGLRREGMVTAQAQRQRRSARQRCRQRGSRTTSTYRGRTR